MYNKDYYRVLGINQDASAKDIKRAYRKLAMQCHPDHNHSKEVWANQKFKEINEAFSVLGDAEKRRQYDTFGLIENIGDIFSGQDVRINLEESENDFGDASLGFDFLDSTFSDDFRGTGYNFRIFGGRFGCSRKTRFETQSGIDLEDMFSQAKSSEMSIVNYEIILSKEQALKGVGKELIRKGKRLKVNIPAGVKTGSRIKLRNALDTTDGQPGDIIINIRVK